jgi:hypothetical protein
MKVSTEAKIEIQDKMKTKESQVLRHPSFGKNHSLNIEVEKEQAQP